MIALSMIQNCPTRSASESQALSTDNRASVSRGNLPSFTQSIRPWSAENPFNVKLIKPIAGASLEISMMHNPKHETLNLLCVGWELSGVFGVEGLKV